MHAKISLCDWANIKMCWICEERVKLWVTLTCKLASTLSWEWKQPEKSQMQEAFELSFTADEQSLCYLMVCLGTIMGTI